MDLLALLDLLELSPPVTFEEVKEQWHLLAKKYHPDKNKETDDKFKQLNTAFSYLQANQNLLTDLKPKNIQNSSGFIHATITVSFEDIYCQREQEITLLRYIRCKSCLGTGSELKKEGVCPYCCGKGATSNKVLSMLNGSTDCQYCGGAGILKGTKCKECKGNKFYKENIKLKIKLDLKHFWNGGDIFRGVGNESSNGAKGDIHIKIDIKPDDRFKIDGSFFTTYVSITPVQKIIGDFGYLDVYGKKLRYDILPQAPEFIIYDSRPNFVYTRKIRVLFIEKPLENLTPEMVILYKKILNLEKGRD